MNTEAPGGSAWTELSGAEVLLRLRLLAEAGKPAISDFIDVHQWHALPAEVILAGGHATAQFRRAALQGEAAAACFELPTAALAPEMRSGRALRSLLSRELGAGSVGDIHVGIEQTAFAAVPGLELPIELRAAQTVEAWPGMRMPMEQTTAATLRADAVIAAVFRVSRSEAQTAIEYGFCFRNFRPLIKRTAELALGDQLVYRTKGRVALLSAQTSKSGRTALRFERFPV